MKVACFAKIDPSIPNINSSFDDLIIVSSSDTSLKSSLDDNHNTTNKEKIDLINFGQKSNNRSKLQSDINHRLLEEKLTVNSSVPSCHICSQSFTRFRRVEEHMNSHYGFRSFKCKLCDFAGKLHLELRKHMKIHKETFKCNYCNYVSVRHSRLNKHVKKQHQPAT